jgi:hypothetical protein
MIKGFARAQSDTFINTDTGKNIWRKNVLSTIRPRKLSESLADALMNGSEKFKERTNNIKFFNWVKERFIENNRECLIYLRSRSHSLKSDTERRESQKRKFSRRKNRGCSGSNTIHESVKKSRSSSSPPVATTPPERRTSVSANDRKKVWENFKKTWAKTGRTGTLSASNEKNDEMTRPVKLHKV